MSRAAFTDTICSVAADGTLKAIGNVQVQVIDLDTDDPVALYAQRSGGVSVGTSLITAPDGLVEFYAEAGEYKIVYTDLTAPARITSPREFGWDSVPGSQNPEALGFSMGDLKLSSNNVDHGRWLRMDGRELTQAEVESALGLGSGDALAFVNYLGTGTSSKYGTAASSKIKLADTRRRVLMGAGPTGDTTPTPPSGTTARKLGDSGGVETVTLTKNESGLPAHGHTVTDAGHTHSNSFATSSAGAHTHTAGTLLATTSDDSNHAHSGFYKSNTGLSGSGLRLVPSVDGGSNIPSATQTDGVHSHAISGSTASGGAHTHPITGSVTANTTGLTVDSNAGADASSAHQNMPPFISVGYLFIRV